ncbi:MAG: hypothetical protein BGO07_01105 [Alphaproteobacteria bacterium 40-19]|nr:MAG: hypothetical protein BGO07_01105 [Alphaproteobacteria bacterium 40-19]
MEELKEEKAVQKTEELQEEKRPQELLVHERKMGEEQVVVLAEGLEEEITRKLLLLSYELGNRYYIEVGGSGSCQRNALLSLSKWHER